MNVLNHCITSFSGIPIAALAAGGVPVDLQTTMEYLDGTYQSSLSFSAMAGLANAYPKL